MVKIYNSLSRSTEEFVPINPVVGIYTCGPTVHDRMHIGNLRTFVLSDILIRTLKINNFEVKSVMNITDIEDKIIKKAAEKNIPISEITDEYTKLFFEDLAKLNILPSDIYPKATEHVEKMIKYIEELINKGLAYEKEGSVYFEISKFSDYGKLSGLDKRQLKSGTRVLSDEYSKDNPQDFALWKFVESDEIGYNSPWGRGRPGWHIECSVMSQEYLGDSFDLHLGGVDLLFPHHENEIAQAQGKTGKPFVRYFVHGEHLLIDSQKMSKSLNNFYTLKDLEEKGFEPLVLRYLFLTAHYRDKLNFTWASLEASQKALNNLRDQVREWNVDEQNQIDNQVWDKFIDSLNNDLNTSQALAVIWDLVKSDNPKKSQTLLEMDKVLGLGLEDYIGRKIDIPEEVQELVNQREQVRKSGDFEKSDKLRKQILDLGFEILDTVNGQKLKRK